MRDAARTFLETTGWNDAQTQPIAGDLSDRTYVRLTKGTKSAILMDAGTDAPSIAPFLAMTEWLHDGGFSAPEIHAQDPKSGLLLLEDLGDTLVRTLLGDAVLNLTIDLLLALRQRPAPHLPCPDATTLCDWTRLADDFYPGAKPSALKAFRAELEPVLHDLLTESATLSLRDFHTDNMMWLPDRDGIRKLGLLDYQDAFLTHPVYDLVSLLTDARTEIPRDLRTRYIALYAEASGDDPDQLSLAFAAFSAQRNMRILGIFHRSAKLSGKTHHLPKIPRVYGYLREALDHPVFARTRDLIIDGLPAP